MKRFRIAISIALAAFALAPGSTAKAKPPKGPPPEDVSVLRLDAGRYTAKLPWFYHGMPFEKHREHDIYSFEANALNLVPGEYNVALIPKKAVSHLKVSFDGRTFDDVPVRDGRAVLENVPIRDRILSFYVKGEGSDESGPLTCAWVYPPKMDFEEAREAGVKFRLYRRDIKLKEREKPRAGKTGTSSIGSSPARASARRNSAACSTGSSSGASGGRCWTRTISTTGRSIPRRTSIVSATRRAAAVCFTYAWRDTGDEDYARRALLAAKLRLQGPNPRRPGEQGPLRGLRPHDPRQMGAGDAASPARRKADRGPSASRRALS